MSKERLAIKKEILRRLTDKTDAECRVYMNPTTDQWEEELPAIHIFARNESLEELTQAPRVMKRTLEMVVEIFGAATNETGLDECLDTIADQVEIELTKDDAFKLPNGECLIEDILLNNVEFEYQGEGNLPMGSARLIFNITYLKGAPDHVSQQLGVSSGDLSGIDVDWDLAKDSDGPDGVIDAEDTIDFPSS